MANTILVVEDDLDTLDVITVSLELSDYEVIVARNGLEGIEKACAKRPDLIVTDLRMPHLDGIEMIRLLRSRPECASVPILVMTAYDMDLAKEAIQAGADRALAKPIYSDLFHVFIKDLLRRRRSIMF
jgi:two-component system, OmpR family, alkaline phosphatase synthesis response regulator PhoP